MTGKQEQDFEADIRIDEFALDKEWVNAPRLYFRYAAKHANAKREWDEAKTELELVKAELDQKIRIHPESFGVEKITEKVVESAIIREKSHHQAVDAVRACRYRADMYSAAVSGMEFRKPALEGLVKLLLADYYSKPKAPKGAEEEVHRMEKRIVRGKGRQRKKRVTE